MSDKFILICNEDIGTLLHKNMIKGKTLYKVLNNGRSRYKNMYKEVTFHPLKYTEKILVSI